MSYMAAVSLLEDYADHPEQYWPPGQAGREHRQVRKLRRSLRANAEALGVDPAQALQHVVALAQARAPNRPPPVYVLGLGGSGSHWLAEMLAELLEGIDSTEVYFPQRLLDRMGALPADQQGFLVDCLHIAHAYGHLTDPPVVPLTELVDARAINPAGGVVQPHHRAWDPHCFVIHMLRDPRDQVVSVTFRKSAYKQEINPDASDDEYLASSARAAVRNYNAWRDSPAAADFLCRYEDLRTAPAEVLDRLLLALGESGPPGQSAQVAEGHDARLMQQGSVPPRGNFYLDDGRGSRREPSVRQRAFLHSELVETRVAAGYPADDCLGQPLDLIPTRGERNLRFPPGDALGTVLVRRRQRAGESEPQWELLDRASGHVVVQGDVAVKLRVHESAPAEAIEALSGLPPDSLDSLCLAGNCALDDDLLGLLVGSLHGLSELDLARTAVTSRGLECLAQVEGLSGLSLLGTGVNQAAVSGKWAQSPSAVLWP